MHEQFFSASNLTETSCPTLVVVFLSQKCAARRLRELSVPAIWDAILYELEH